MSRDSLPIKAILLAIVLGAIGWLLYLSIEFYEENEPGVWSTEALLNPYLACMNFCAARKGLSKASTLHAPGSVSS